LEISTVNDIFAPPPGDGPWRLLILNRDPGDPFWVIATVALPEDVHPAQVNVGGEPGWLGVGQWVTSRLGQGVAMVAMHNTLVWLLDEGGQPR
jgi:hypothetical protein